MRRKKLDGRSCSLDLFLFFPAVVVVVFVVAAFVIVVRW